jgi:transcriptional regulator of arginine metabolism
MKVLTLSTSMAAKNKRQQRLLSLIKNNELSTQTELVEALEKSGLSVTQSSVSRDLEELGVIKVRGMYKVSEGENTTHLPGGARALRRAGDSLLVLTCHPGFASAISSAIDQAQIDEIVGTIAGDDTIFIAVNGARAQSHTAKLLCDLFSISVEG